MTKYANTSLEQSFHVMITLHFHVLTRQNANFYYREHNFSKEYFLSSKVITLSESRIVCPLPKPIHPGPGTK